MAMTAMPRALALVLPLSWLMSAAGHGVLTEPPARNVASGPKNGYCPHCGNGNGVCGDGNQWPADSNYLNFYTGPVKTWTAGTVVEVEVKITAHHKGHFEFSVCDEVLDGSVSNPQGCLDKWILRRASPEEAGLTNCLTGDRRSGCQPLDTRHPERFYLPPQGFSSDGDTHRFYLKVPSGLSCEACTLQWRWWSANSCTPGADYGCYATQLSNAGYDAASWGVSGSCPGGGCSRCGCGEEFRNCADIAVRPASGGTHTTTTSTTTSSGGVETTAPATTTTTATTTAARSGGSGCIRNPDCEANAWCNNHAYLTWCPQQIANGGSCPSPQCTSGSSSATQTTSRITTSTPVASTTTTTSSPSPQPSTPAPSTTSSSLLGCRAVGGADFGSSDERCAEVCALVEEGTWPCAGQMCDCSVAVVAMAEVGVHSM
eukprot:gb/GFBE01008132.1/.p1 GENE.gb/GFBE01008132.1/~~gb/GFBE01008132.1/.p1  ORF type:complete len:430 (+),score=72.85 gb/GFBE01008132.1/:1-1290(+)